MRNNADRARFTRWVMRLSSAVMLDTCPNLSLTHIVPRAMRPADLGQSAGGPAGRHWVLDPIDGTRGFVGMRQYAVCLGLLQDGEVVAGVLGCPNLPQGAVVDEDGGAGESFWSTVHCCNASSTDAGSVAMHEHGTGFSCFAWFLVSHCTMISTSLPARTRTMTTTHACTGAAGRSDSTGTGCLFLAHRGHGAFAAPLSSDGKPERIHVNASSDMAAARFMESYESRHSDHSFAARVVSVVAG